MSTLPLAEEVLARALCEVARAPLLGEHNEYALKEILGMTDDEIADLAGR